MILLLAACSSRPADQVREAESARTALTTAGTSRSQATPVGKDAAPIYALVQLTERPTAVTFGSRLAGLDGAAAPSGTDATVEATAAAIEQLRLVQTEQASFAARVATAQVPGTGEVYRLQRVYNGILYATDAAGVARLRAIPGARAVHIVTPQVADNAFGVPLVGAPQLWSNLGLPLHGEAIRVGVIDTGIDYTHANFGGPGLASAYAANDPNVVEPGSFPTAKVVGGWDFAGATYDASSAANAFPMPDADPLDGNGHGSHVSGTVAGYGVNADGSTYAGSYDLSLDPTTLRIGPGAAPLAELYALKVFGDGGGSTSLAALALEWAVDPNGDGNFADHLDVVNLSLGSSFGTSADSDAAIYTAAVNAGVVVVTSAGNANDVYFITGAPGSTPSVISVAATSVGESAGVRVNAPASIAGLKAAGAASFGPLTWPAVTGDVVASVPATACTSATAIGVTNGAELAGKVALIARGTCSFALKTWAAQQAGAIAVIITNNAAGDPPGMAGVATPDPITIPTRSVSLTDGNAIRAVLTATPPEVVNVTIDDFTVFQDPTKIDTIASFSSRGPSRVRNQAVLKPDVAAPGVNVISTSIGSGFLGESLSGTSMASPLTAGTMALLRQLHPTWTPAQLKALLMNTAGHDIFNLPTTSPTRARVSPARVGAGRIDAVAALAASVIAYDKAAPERVSVSFATTDVASVVNETRTIEVANTGAADVTFDVTVDAAVAPPGTQVTAGAATVTVTAGATADLAVQLAVDPAAMVRQRDATVPGTQSLASNLPRAWLSEASGYVVLTPQGGGPVLRVPYFAAPTPASSMATTGPLATAGATGASDLTLAGTGVDTRGLAVAPQQGVLSLVTPFELAYASSKNPPVGGPVPVGLTSVETDNANLRYVGVTSNLADVVDPASAEIYFGITTYGLWGSPSDVEFDIYLRQAGAPDWEFVLYNTDFGRSSTVPGTDVHVTRLLNLATGAAVTQDFLNGVTSAQYHVPSFLSDTMVMPVFAGDLFPGPDTALEYQVVAFSSAASFAIDVTPVLRYDLQAPAFATTIDPALADLGPGYTPFRVDADAASFSVQYDLDRARATQTGAMLLLHHHNGFGQRAEMVPVAGLTCAAAADCAATPATPVCDVASGACVGCVSNAECGGGGAFCDSFGTRTCVSPDCRLVGAPACADHFSCSADYGTCLPNQQLVLVLNIPPNSTCAAGGVQINTGFDDNRNGVLDAGEVLTTSYVCNGLSATVTPEPAGANCAAGGVKVQVGTGTPTYVCNGATGATGADGQSATVTPEPAGANCATGGVMVQVGTGTPTYVCNGATGATGAAGADGQSATVTPEPAGANCATGGLRVQVGSGTPAYVCNGAVGADGQSATVTPEPAGANCAAGGLAVSVGGAAATYVCNGSDGATGATGPTGPVGPTGATGPTGPKGSSGCSSVGGGSSAFSLLGLGALLWRRRRSARPAAR